MSIVVKADLVGKWQIPLTGINDAVLTSIITDVEERYCIALLGADLYKAIITAPTLPRYAFLIAGGYYKENLSIDDEYVNVKLCGLKEMLKYYTFAEYMMHTRKQVKPTGMATPGVENGSVTDSANFSIAMQSMYNEGFNIGQEIVRFIMLMNFDTEILSSVGADALTGYPKFFDAGNVVKINGVENAVVSTTNNTIKFANDVTGTDIEYIFYRNFIHTPSKRMSIW
jgi:hypothetical protein